MNIEMFKNEGKMYEKCIDKGYIGENFKYIYSLWREKCLNIFEDLGMKAEEKENYSEEELTYILSMLNDLMEKADGIKVNMDKKSLIDLKK